MLKYFELYRNIIKIPSIYIKMPLKYIPIQLRYLLDILECIEIHSNTNTLEIMFFIYFKTHFLNSWFSFYSFSILDNFIYQHLSKSFSKSTVVIGIKVLNVQNTNHYNQKIKIWIPNEILSLQCYVYIKIYCK
jgi:hypothetical protein